MRRCGQRDRNTSISLVFTRPRNHIRLCFPQNPRDYTHTHTPKFETEFPTEAVCCPPLSQLAPKAQLSTPNKAHPTHCGQAEAGDADDSSLKGPPTPPVVFCLPKRRRFSFDSAWLFLISAIWSVGFSSSIPFQDWRKAKHRGKWGFCKLNEQTRPMLKLLMFLQAFENLKISLAKLRLLKQDLPVHGHLFGPERSEFVLAHAH